MEGLVPNTGRKNKKAERRLMWGETKPLPSNVSTMKVDMRP